MEKYGFRRLSLKSLVLFSTNPDRDLSTFTERSHLIDIADDEELTFFLEPTEISHY